MPDHHPFPPGSHIFGYLRDSGHEDQELSISQQETALRDWCAQNGLILSRTYKDEARRGSSIVARDQLHEMMNAFRHDCSEAGVIVWKYNRFARNVDNAQYYRAEIRSRGYVFFSLNDRIPDGPEGRLLEAVIDYKDEQYLTDLSIDVKRGLRDLVLMRGCVPGVPPVGFKREEVVLGQRRDGRPHIANRWVPDPVVAQRVRQAFEMRAVGASLGVINKETQLYKSINSYRTFWTNKLYLGILEYGDLTIENYCEPLVDKDTWDKVQVLQSGYTRHNHMQADAINHPRRVASPYLLSGIAHCARCGSPLFGTVSKQRNGSEMRSYFCSRAYRNRDCVRHRLPIDALEKTVVDALRDEWLTMPALSAAFEKLENQTSERRTQENQQRAQLTAELGEIRRQITNLSDAIADAGHSRALLKRLADLELQETDLLSRMAALENQALQDVPQITREQLVEQIKSLDIILQNMENVQEKRNLLKHFIQRVDVDREASKLFGVITFFYPPGSDLYPNEKPPPSNAHLGGGAIITVRKSRDPSGPLQVNLDGQKPWND